MGPKRVSIKDVAKLARVSITTVSRVMNGVSSVSRRNVARVEEAISRLKYRPNVSAQRLASGVNNTVGLVMPGYPGVFHSWFAVEIIRGVGHACETLHLDMVFRITDGKSPLNAGFMGGIIFADIIENRRQVIEALERHIPCLVINNIVRDMDVGFIAVDNVAGGRIAAEYLHGLGHRRIATVTGELKTQAGLERNTGFLRGLEEAGLLLPPEQIVRGDYSRRSARDAAERLLLLPERPTAVFVQSDDMAQEVIAVLQERGLRVPQDISVVGFDDNTQALYGPVGLTTVRQPVFAMAEKAVRVLHGMINGREQEMVRTILTPELVIRDSSAPPVS